MNKLKRTTANLPEDLLSSAVAVTGKGITDTLIIGLKMVKRSGAYEKALSLKGKLNLSIDTDFTRERSRS